MYYRESTQNQKTSPEFFFLVGMVCLFIGLIFLPEAIRDYKLNKMYEHQVPSHVFEEYPTIFGDVDNSINSYFVNTDHETKIRVYFERRNSMKGWWRGSNALMQINAPYFQTLSATTNTEDKWGFIIVSNDVDEFTPWLDITFSIDPKYYHTLISASISLDIVYPDSDGTSFMNHEEHFSRDIQFYVTSDGDDELQKARKSWEYEMSWFDYWGLPFLFFAPA
jgi:hypothetical protein